MNFVKKSEKYAFWVVSTCPTPSKSFYRKFPNRGARHLGKTLRAFATNRKNEKCSPQSEFIVTVYVG